MFKAGVIALIIIILQVTTFAAAACDWKQISPSFIKNLNAHSNHFKCTSVQANDDEKLAKINCSNEGTYFVFYAHNSIYMQTVSSIRNNILTKCYREGIINDSCEATVSPNKCQSYDLDIF